MKKERNYWPHVIVGMILGTVVAAGWTVKIALDNPVQEDTYFMDKYQYVDTNINALLEKKALFDKNFEIIYQTDGFKLGKNSFKLLLKNRNSSKSVENAQIELLISRPETNEFNQKLNPSKVMNGIYVFNDINISRLGRWQILTKTKIDNFEGFNQYEVNATK